MSRFTFKMRSLEKLPRIIMAPQDGFGELSAAMTSNVVKRPSGSINFSAPWGTAVRVISAVATFVLVGASCIVLMAVRMPVPAQIIIAVTPLLILIGAVAFMILGYSVDGDALIVKRPGWTTRIPLAGLKSVEFDPDGMKGAIRVVGNGGLFCFNGLFWSKRLKKFRVYVTDLNRAVILRFPDRIAIVSPDNPTAFVNELRKRLAD